MVDNGGSVAFWEQQLLGKPPLLLLPTDKPRTSSASSLFQVPFHLPVELVSKLGAIGSEAAGSATSLEGRRIGLSWATLAAFQVLLGRYSRQDDITVGVPAILGGKELLALRVDLDKNPSFRELVALNAQTAMAISQHADVSLQQLASAVKADKFDFSTGLHPIFQVAFIMNGSAEARRLGQGFNLDILLEVKEVVGGHLEGFLCGKETFFSVATIERMAKHFKNLVEVIVKASEYPINSLDFVDDEEREVVLDKFNATAKELPPPYANATIHGLFEHWATQTPDAKAITYEGKSLTYKELDERANQLARFLEANGVKDEQPVGVMLERSLEMMIAMMAVLKAGGAYVPMDPEYPADRLAIMAEDAEVPVLLSMSHIDAYIPLPPSAQRVNLDTDWGKIAAYPAERPSQSRSHPNGLAYIIFTSGSTGRPKGTLLQHSGLINYLYYLTSEHDLGANDIFLQKTPISFDVSVRELFFAFSVGAELVFAVPGGHRDTQYLAELIAEKGITCCSFVPSQLEIFLQEVDGAACRALRRVFVSGEALPPTSVAKFLELLPHAQLHNLYGPTEATVDVTGYDVRLHKGRATVPIGYPIANVKMYVLDAQMRPLPVGVPGELMISSLQLARGYIKRPDLTAEKFIDCPFGTGDYGKMYRTGDLARWLPEGVIEFLGRLDHQVKLRGFRIELGEIENGLCNCPGIRQAVVVVVKDKAGTNHLVAYVTPDLVDIPAAIRELGANVPEYMVPEVIIPMKELPSLPNGKVNRRGLPEPDFSQTATEDYNAPRNGIEEEIQYAWHEVFQIQPISVDADFFKIGGNSLLAGKIISRLRSAFSVELPFTSIFQHRTIADMALFIQSKLQGPNATPAAGAAATADGEHEASNEITIPVFYDEKERVAGAPPCSYSQELLVFNNELDPFNPVHNEAAWVRIKGDLDVAALVRALRYLVDRHTVLSSHLAVAGVKGPNLKQTRPAKFKLPVSYIDLETGEELQVPEVLQRAASIKKASLPANIAKRRARLQTLKTVNANLVAHPNAPAEEEPVEEPVEKRDEAHFLPTKAAGENLAEQVERFQAQSNSPEDAEKLQRLRTWLRSGIPEGGTDSVGATNGTEEGNNTQPVSVASSHSSVEDLNAVKEGNGRLQTLHSDGTKSIASTTNTHDNKPLLNTNGAPQSQQMEARERGVVAREKQGCFSFKKEKPVHTVHSAQKSFKGKPLEVESDNATIKEVEAIAWRVKKSLALHWLTCGIYSTRQSGGTQGFWKGIRDMFGGSSTQPARQLKEEVEDEGGILIPELSSSRASVQKLREVLLKEASQPFKLMRGPLLRVKLVQVTPDEHVLLLTMHHAVTDGWSTGIIWKELSAAYNAFHKGKTTVGLEPLPIQYADFATWQRRWLAQGAMSKQLKFWRQHLEGAKAQWDFPTDFVRPAVPSGNSARVPITLKPEAVQAMKGLIGQVNCTMFMALLSAFNVLLAHYSNEESIVCGVPYAGRDRAETEGLIGAFMGAVALRADLKGNPSFRQVMQRVRKAALEVFENADVPVHLVMTDILGMSNLGGCAAPPLFQSMFFLHDSSWLEGLNLEGLQADLPCKVEKNVARFDLTLEMTMDAAKNQIGGHIEYRTDLFRRSTIENFVKHFEVLLDGVIAKPDSSIWDLPLLTAADQKLLGSAKGVPSHLLPSNANAKQARPKIMSSRGFQLPPGVPGLLSIAYASDVKGASSQRPESLKSNNSFMGILSGGFGLKKFFEDNEKDKPAPAPTPTAAPANPPASEGSRHSDTAAGTSQAFEMSSRTRPALPSSPWGEPELDGTPLPALSEPQASAPPQSPGQPLDGRGSLSEGLGFSRKRSLLASDLDQSISTGLIAKITPEGKLEVVGQARNKVDVSGVMTQLEDIDRQIMAAAPQVERSATVWVQNQSGENKLVTYLSPVGVNVVQLEDTLRDRIPAYMIPYLFQPLHRLPLTPYGEVDRAALPAPRWAEKVVPPYLPPQNRLEMEVQLIWVAVMNKKEMISCDADFSAVGGNMMHAVISNGIVREALGVQMPALNIFRDRTISNVAERIRQLRQKKRQAQKSLPTVESK